MKAKHITYYELYAERHQDYGRTHIGNYATEELAEECRKACIKKCAGKGHPSNDGYYATDWQIEENDITIMFNKLKDITEEILK